MNYFSREPEGISPNRESLRLGATQYRERESLWSGVTDQVSDALNGHKDQVRDTEAEYQRLRRANRAIEGSLSFSGILKSVGDAAERRASKNLDAGLINRVNPFTPSNRKIAGFSNIPLQERIAKSAEMEAAFENPASQLGLNERQQHVAAATLKRYNKYIRSSERGSIDLAKRELEKPFGLGQKAMAFITGDRRALRDMKQIEQALSQVKDRNIAYFKEVKDIRKPLAASIKVEQREVAKAISDALKPGIFGGASLKDSLDALSEEQIASNPKLQALADIIEDSQTGTKRDILKVLEEQRPDFSHSDLQTVVQAADGLIKPMLEEAREARELAQIRRDMVKKYSKKIEKLAQRETTISIGGKERKISKLLDDMAENADESGLTDEAAEKLMDRIADLEISGLVDESEAAVIRRGVNIMSNPNFDPDDVPDLKMDAIFKAKTWDHYKRTLRDGALTAGKWANENIITHIKDASEKVSDKLGETYLRANAAFYDAVREKATHPISSKYHEVKDGLKNKATAGAVAASLSTAEPEERTPVWMAKALNETRPAFIEGEERAAAQLQPEVFASAAANIATTAEEDTSHSGGHSEEEKPDFDPLTEDSDTANAPDRLI